MESIFGKGHIKKKGKDLPEVVGAVDEVKIESRRKDKLKTFDKYLKVFKYGAALDSGIQKVSRRSAFLSILYSPSISFGDGLSSWSCQTDRLMLTADCPTIDIIRFNPRTNPPRWTSSSPLRKRRRSARTYPYVPIETYYRSQIRRDGS
jgi:hypothetical protein